MSIVSTSKALKKDEQVKMRVFKNDSIEVLKAKIFYDPFVRKQFEATSLEELEEIVRKKVEMKR